MSDSTDRDQLTDDFIAGSRLRSAKVILDGYRVLYPVTHPFKREKDVLSGMRLVADLLHLLQEEAEDADAVLQRSHAFIEDNGRDGTEDVMAYPIYKMGSAGKDIEEALQDTAMDTGAHPDEWMYTLQVGDRVLVVTDLTPSESEGTIIRIECDSDDDDDEDNQYIVQLADETVAAYEGALVFISRPVVEAAT